MEDVVLNQEDIKKYWNNIFKVEKFNEDETARIVFQAKVKPEFLNRPDNDLKDFQVTENIQLRSADELINYLEFKINDLPQYDCGISISSAIFSYDPNNINETTGKVKAPNKHSFKKINTLVFDIDAHIKGTKDRFFIFSLEDDYIQHVIMRSYMELMRHFDKYNYPIVIPNFTICSGGGIQIAFDFDRDIYKEEAELIFKRLKTVLPKDRFGCMVKDLMGNFVEIEMDIDPTFADITHTQRLAGVPNQKYNYTPTFFNTDIFNFSEQEVLKNTLKNHLISIDEDILDSNYTDIIKKRLEDYFKVSITEYQKLSLKVNDDLSREYGYLALNANYLKEDAMISHHQANSVLNPAEFKGVEYEILTELKNAFNRKEIDIQKFFPDFTFENHGDYYKILCPFHEERTASMAFYTNSLIFKDFHDDKIYTIVSFWEKLHNVNKAVALSQLAEIAGIKIKKTDRKDFEKMELEELINMLIQKVDIENYVYYRLANKNRNCIVRHIPTGESFSFDGIKMLSNHVLHNQLNIQDADKELLNEFQEVFEKKILIEAFEEFHPGKPTVFSRNFIKFVNMWVPSDNYKLSIATAENQRTEVCPDGFDLLALEDFLRNECPASYLYIQQMVQRGDLHWFLNWLASTAQFKVLPTIPVVFGIGGAGKNLFVNTMLEWFLNDEYVKVLSGDRVMSNFNSAMETASLLVLDEGDFSNSQQVDYLKLLSGNDKVVIEKKGVDAVSKQKFFNIIFFSNGEVPVRHPSQDRRIVYFNNEITLLELVNAMDITIDDFIKKIKEELSNFWGALLNTNINLSMSMSNNKDGLFYRQVLKMHSFGDLVVKMLEGEWTEIALQLNENVSDPTIMKTNLELLDTIQNQFNKSGSVSLTLINRYLQSLNYKYKTSIQKYIQSNGFSNFGITIDIVEGEVKINLDRKKLKQVLYIENILIENNERIAKKLGRVKKKIQKMNPLEVINSGDKIIAEEEAVNYEKVESVLENNSSGSINTDIEAPPLKL